ncbi:hypothetical protein ACQYWY_07035 [Comamonas sediminis]|uniref:hypothetical protein n=1 Tax=Comamonas sediminis TaxID=1783360 RepID=UPI003D294520
MAENNSSAPLKTAEGAICERCAGSGEDPEGFLTTGRGPDDYTVDGPCRQCGGSGEAVAAQAAPAAVAVPDEYRAFETWAKSHYPDIDLEREADGYRHALAQEWWDAWQARAALAATPALPATEDSSAGDLAEVPDGFGSAEHWKEKAQYWAGVAHKLRGQALRGEPVDGIIQPTSQAEVQAEPVIYVSRGQLETHTDPDSDGGRYLPARRTPLGLLNYPLYTAPQAQPADAPIAYLQEADQHLLHRFIETTEDDESFDIGKDAVKRLANLGVVESCGFGRYGVTMFGYWVHEHYWHQNPSLPLKTNADRDREHRAAMAAAQEGGNAAKEA